MRRIYLASSWRNQYHKAVLDNMRLWGHQVYDFKNPMEGLTGFAWRQVRMPERPDAKEQKKILLLSERVAQGFMNDFRAMLWADTCVLLLPCGRSAHLEAGYCAGAGKRTIVFLCDGEEPDLMNLLLNELVTSFDELKTSLM
jgi:nucleoside 2-deoxyribosyltransferase